MNDQWSYDNSRYIDKNGERWHFVRRSFLSETVPYEERPIEIYFRNNKRTCFGLIRFDHSKDNPYKYEKIVEKIMRDKEFREKHVNHKSKIVWLDSWK